MVQGPGTSSLGDCLCGDPYEALRLTAIRRVLILMAGLKELDRMKGVALVSGLSQFTQRREETIPSRSCSQRHLW